MPGPGLALQYIVTGGSVAENAANGTVVGTVAGVDPAGAFAQAILDDHASLDVAAAEREVVEAAERLVRAHPEVGAVVLECANMPPYARAVSARLGLPVHDIVSFGRWFYAGVEPAAFPRS